MQLGIKEGDKFKKLVYNGEEITVVNSPRWIELRDSAKIGVPFTWIVERDGKELQLTTLSRKKEIILTHKIMLAENPTQAQILFRNKWLSKLGNN
jgi:IS5 family transposase